MKKTSGVLSVVIVLLLLFAIASRPDTFRVERSVTIQASADSVFTLVNDFRQWEQWSPWWKLEPTQQVSFTGAPSGAGAIYEWSGRQTGSGRMEILESRSAEYVRIRLDFIEPMRATNTIEYSLAPAQGGVVLTWVMSGENTFVGKALLFFASMDEVMGRDFEQGLADIKSVAEAAHGAATPSMGAATLHGDAAPSRDTAVGLVVTTRKAPEADVRHPQFPRE